MAQTTIASGNQVTQWRKKFFAEYVRDTIFSPYFGTNENSIIQIIEDLTSKAGKIVSLPLVTRLTNAGVTGDNTLAGNEEALGNYNHDINIDQIRNAVVIGKMEQQSTEIDCLEAARTMLKLWIMDDLRDSIIQALQSPVVDGVTAYASATEGQKDTWVAAQRTSATNARVTFGAVQSNYSASDHSASLANVDSTTDVLDFDIIQLVKRLMKKASPHQRPVKVKGGREFYVAFCSSFSFRDLKVDTESIHQNAGPRGDDNMLFQDPDLNLDGVLCREVPEIPVLAGVGASAIDVESNFMCGAQAIGLAWARHSRFVVDRDAGGDYENQTGVAVGEIRGVEKPTFNSVQHGVHTFYTSGVADS
jgi:N4-gp56 family major capsid protein